MSIVTINDEHLTDIAEAIRRKNGTDNTYTPDKMADAIKDIQGGAEPVLEEVMVFPKTEKIIITPSEDFDGISKVIVNPVTSDIDSDIKSSNIKKGVNILGVAGTLEEGITPSGTFPITENGEYDITNYANASVNVPSVEPTGEIEITVNGTYDVKDYASANVQIEGGASKYAPRHILFQNYKGTELNEELENLDTSNLTSMASMFSGCSSLTTVNLTNKNTENVKDMSSLFTNCSKLTNVQLKNIDTSNVTDMRNMFNNCTSLPTLDVSSLDTQSVTNMSYMFATCSKLLELDVSNFDVTNCTNMLQMFNRLQTVTSLDLSSWNTSNVTNMGTMFGGCNNLKEIDLRNFTIKNTCSISYMFSSCQSLEKIDFRNATISTNISNYTGMFNSVPTNCLIIVATDSIKSWFNSKFSSMKNVKTLAEYLAEGGV